ncbi:5-hydroxytryptamine receptor 4 [Pyricularia oryzae]
MHIIHISKFMALLAIGTIAFPTRGRSEVDSRDVNQAQTATSGSSIAPSGSEKRPAWKAEFAEQIAEAQRDKKPFQCPHCKDGISNRVALYTYVKAFHGDKPVYSLKNYHDEHRFDS